MACLRKRRWCSDESCGQLEVNMRVCLESEGFSLGFPACPKKVRNHVPEKSCTPHSLASKIHQSQRTVKDPSFQSLWWVRLLHLCVYGNIDRMMMIQDHGWMDKSNDAFTLDLHFTISHRLKLSTWLPSAMPHIRPYTNSKLVSTVIFSSFKLKVLSQRVRLKTVDF
jgi:hypothetical protein